MLFHVMPHLLLSSSSSGQPLRMNWTWSKKWKAFSFSSLKFKWVPPMISLLLYLNHFYMGGDTQMAIKRHRKYLMGFPKHSFSSHLFLPPIFSWRHNKINFWYPSQGVWNLLLVLKTEDILWYLLSFAGLGTLVNLSPIRIAHGSTKPFVIWNT